MLSHNSSNKPIPKNPKEFFIANKNSNLTDILELLMSDSPVVVNDSYSLGLKILNNLKKILKKKYPFNNYSNKRQYRKHYRSKSHNLFLRIKDQKLQVKNAPDIGWLELFYPKKEEFYLSFPEIQGLNGSWQWYKNGIKFDFLDFKIHPYYDVYFPTRLDHILLFDEWLSNYQGPKNSVIDVGFGSGILSFILMKYQFNSIIGTEINPNAIIGIHHQLKKLNHQQNLQFIKSDLLSGIQHQNIDLIVFNPPWLPAQHPIKSGIDKAIYYPTNLFFDFFTQAISKITSGGNIILLFSNMAELFTDTDNPIQSTLEKFPSLHIKEKLQRKASSSSNKTRRKSNTKNQFVEMWVIQLKE